jgi:hypothetical protein
MNKDPVVVGLDVPKKSVLTWDDEGPYPRYDGSTVDGGSYAPGMTFCEELGNGSPS